jgi:hypothetical protein
MPASTRRVDLRLTIPTGASYHSLAAELAARFAEYSGAQTADAQQLGKAVARLAASVAAGAADGSIAVTMEVGARELIVTATSGSRTDRATCPLQPD